MADYVSKARVTKISAESSVTIKIRDNYYKVAYTEERELPTNDVDMELERQFLFDTVNAVVDQQADDILKSFQKSK